jgi:hypothetical protein
MKQSDCFAKVGQAFLARLALAVGAGHFGAASDIPGAVSLDDRSEPSAHL